MVLPLLLLIHGCFLVLQFLGKPLPLPLRVFQDLMTSQQLVLQLLDSSGPLTNLISQLGLIPCPAFMCGVEVLPQGLFIILKALNMSSHSSDL